MAPTTTKQWTVTSKDGFDSLKFTEKAEIPQLGDHDVLVNFHYASLNYRDLIIPKGKYGFPINLPVVPASDGAGTVTAVGPRVKQFREGDAVLTLFNQSHLAGDITVADTLTGLGGTVDGTLRQYGVFEENGLVKKPQNLSFKEASTLPCAALTAWNALYGLQSKRLMGGDWVLTQGTGGVSIFAVQFAKAVGAHVIATTSSDEKAKTLKKLGADHVLNYKTNPAWGEEAKKLTGSNGGVNHVLEVGGPTTMKQSLEAVRPEGVISIIGFLGGVKGEDQPGFLECLNKLCTVRGVLVGNRQLFEDMVKAYEGGNVGKPVVDEKVFGLEQLKDSYQYMWEQKHFGKLVVRVDDGGGSKL